MQYGDVEQRDDSYLRQDEVEGMRFHLATHPKFKNHQSFISGLFYLIFSLISNPCLKEEEREGPKSLTKSSHICAFKERLVVDLNLSHFAKQSLQLSGNFSMIFFFFFLRILGINHICVKTNVMCSGMVIIHSANTY